MASRGTYKYGIYAPCVYLVCAQDAERTEFIYSNAESEIEEALKYRWADKKYRLFYVFGVAGRDTFGSCSPSVLFEKLERQLCAVHVRGKRGGFKRLWIRDTYDASYAFDSLPDLSFYGGTE